MVKYIKEIVLYRYRRTNIHMKSQDCNNMHETYKFKPDKNISTEKKLPPGAHTRKSVDSGPLRPGS